MIETVKALIAMYLPEDREGQGLVEYALIIALIAILLVTALGVVKDALVTVFTTISDALTAAS